VVLDTATASAIAGELAAERTRMAHEVIRDFAR
jgi:hypothetical protein